MRCGALALLILLTFAPLARAESARSAQASTMHAQVSLDFRIVIPETVQLPTYREEGARGIRRFVSRTTQAQPDRIVVTIAKP